MTTPSAAAPAIDLADEAAYLEAVAQARKAADAYYGAGESGLDDDAYDRLLRGITAWELAHPGQVAADSPSQVVRVTTGDIAHTVPMLSLGNVFSEEDLTAWAASLKAAGRGRGRRVGRGAQARRGGLAARYRDGRLTVLVTRGDGTTGEDESHAIGDIVGIPQTLTEPVTIEVRGEVLMTEEQFAAANELRTAHGATAFANRRNASSGSLRAKDRAYRIKQTFLAYAALTSPSTPTSLALPISITRGSSPALPTSGWAARSARRSPGSPARPSTRSWNAYTKSAPCARNSTSNSTAW
ncbi:hypothetical protein ACU686_07700 [Yinghuangia aomiensis]